MINFDEILVEVYQQEHLFWLIPFPAPFSYQQKKR